MEEVWKDIQGFEDSYQISTLGRVRSKDRFRNVCGGAKRFIKGEILKPTVCTNGYLEVHLHRNCKRKVELLHRLVARAFLDNPNNLPEVNHKDENIANCSVDNLEWCTSKYNANYGTRNAKCKLANKKFEKPVNQYSLDGQFVKRHNCLRDAYRETGADTSAIIRVCQGKSRTAGGYKWEYA